MTLRRSLLALAAPALALAALAPLAGCELTVIDETPDSAPPGDGGASSDAFVDLNPDGGDGGAGKDASASEIATKVNDFLSRQADAFCGALKTACGNPATWQTGKCTSTYLTGFANLYEDLREPGVAASGHLLYSQADADLCVAKIAAIPLPTRTAAQHAAIVEACKAVVVGTQPLGKPCGAAIECQPGMTCKNIKNGAGTCAALDVEGARCEYPTTGKTRSNTCSYHGVGETGLFCSNTDGVSGVCTKLQPAGSACGFDTQCASNLCAPDATFTTATCVESYNELTANGSCPYFSSP